MIDNRHISIRANRQRSLLQPERGRRRRRQLLDGLFRSTLQRDLYGDMNMQYGTFNLVFKPSMDGRAKPYVVAGLGVYYRPIKVTTPGAGYVPPYCSPWWYYCYPGGVVPVDYIIAEQSSTDFGMDFGAGVDIAMTDAASFYLEARYHYIFGPELKDQTG